MKIETVDSGNERTIVIKEELLSSFVMKLDEVLTQFIKEDQRDLIIDIGNVLKMDSMAISVFLRTKKKLMEDNRNLTLINPNETVSKILELAGLDSYLCE